jgi:hypothetical protein
VRILLGVQPTAHHLPDDHGMEILVHISTSATRQNDDLYRSLADAYVNFEAYQPTPIEMQKESNDLEYPKARPAPTFRSSIDTTIDLHVSNASRDSYGSFPSHVSSDNCAKALAHPDIQRSFGESVESNSLFPTSRLGQLERIQVDWRKRKDPKLSGMHERRSGVKPFITSTNVDTSFIADSQLAAQAIESQLYEQGSATSEDTSEDESMEEPGPEPLQTRNPAKQPPFSQSPIHSHKADEESHNSTEVVPMLHSTQVNTSSATNVVNDSLGDLSAVPEFLDFSKLPFEVFPPAPEVSIESPGTLPSQITTHLGAIQKQNPKRFKPSKISRTLELDERGYWLIESTTWPQVIQYEFWSSLCKHVKGGRFGWGVTLYRDPPNPQTKGPQGTNDLGSVRLYCWGEIVEHIWLSLWLCSKGKVAGSGLRWFDAEDNVVIRVP